MIETPRLKNVVIFIQTILSFVLSRKITSTFPMHQVSQLFVIYQYDLRMFLALFVSSDYCHGLLMRLCQVDIN